VQAPHWTLGRVGVRLVDGFRRTDSLRLYPGLMASQQQSPAALQEAQWEALRALIGHAARQVPYYRRLFQERGLEPEDFREPADLALLPRLTKEIIRREGAAMLAEDWRRYQPRPKATSGSTGVPLRYWIDRRSHGHHWAFIWRAWALSGFRPGDRWAALSGGALVPEQVDFRQRVYLWLNGALHLPSYHLSDAILDRYAAILEKARLPLVYAYPSSLRLFARHLAQRGRRIAPQHFFTTSELLPPAWRAEIEAATGGRVHDIYGNNDGGILAFECAEHAGYHLNMEGAFVEVVDAEDRTLAPGEQGEILSSNLLNYAMPFLRYAPGDAGRLATAACPCGRGLQRLAAVEGRVRDVIITGSGRRVHGAFFNHFEPFYAANWLEAFQVRQRLAGEIALTLAVRRPPSEAELEALRSALERGLGSDTRIDVHIVDEIPRGKAGKHRLIVSEIAD